MLQVVLVGAALAFLGHRLLSNLDQVRAFSWQVRPLRLALCLALEGAVYVFGTAVWCRILARFDTPVPLAVVLRIWSTATLGRYIPGTIWQFMIGARLADRYLVPPALLLVSFFVQTAITIVAAGAVAFTVLSRVLPLPLRIAGAFVIASTFVHPRVIDGARRVLARVLRRELPGWRGSWRDGVVLVALDVVGWVAYGLAFWLLLASVTEMPTSRVVDAIGIHAAVFVSGYSIVVIPAGFGVRETALTLLLGGWFSPGVAAALAALTRVWTIAGELVTLAVSLGVLRPRSR